MSLQARKLLFILDTVVVEWVGLASLFGFVAMGADKLLAFLKRKRISERTLWLTALVGGFPGILAGGYVFRHKMSKSGFWAPVAVAAAVWGAAMVLSLVPPNYLRP